MDSPSTNIINPGNATMEQLLQVVQLRQLAWPRSSDPVVKARKILQALRSYAGPPEQEPQHIVVRGNGRLIAAATTFPRTIEAAGDLFQVMALSSVCTHPEHRGEGLGRIVVQQAFARVDAAEFPFSLFQTSVAVQPFYEKLGACEVLNAIIDSTAEAPQRCPFWDDVIMRYPAGDGWPEGMIDLRGPGY